MRRFHRIQIIIVAAAAIATVGGVFWLSRGCESPPTSKLFASASASEIRAAIYSPDAREKRWAAYQLISNDELGIELLPDILSDSIQRSPAADVAIAAAQRILRVNGCSEYAHMALRLDPSAPAYPPYFWDELRTCANRAATPRDFYGCLDAYLASFPEQSDLGKFFQCFREKISHYK